MHWLEMGGLRTMPRNAPCFVVVSCLAAMVFPYPSPAQAERNPAAEVRRLVEAARDPRPEVWREAVETLSEIADPRAREELAATLDSEDASVRWAAAEGLGRIGSKQSFEPLAAALADPHWNVRQAAAKALGAVGDARAVGPLRSLLQDPEWRVRHAAVESLCRLGHPSAIKPLIAALADEVPEVRLAAAAALANLPDAASVPALVRLLDDAVPVVRAAAARALGAIENPAAVAPLAKALASGDPSLVYAAATALIAVGPPAVEPLVQMVVAREPGFQPAILILGDLADARTVDVLTRTLESDDVKVRAWAALALGRIGDDAAGAIPKLLDMLGDATEVRHGEGTFCTLGGAAAAALGGMGAPARRLLLARRNEGPPGARADAVAALAVAASHQPPDAEVLGALTAAAEDTDPNVRYFAVIGLSMGSAPGRLAAIARQADAPEPLVRHAVIAALGRLECDRALAHLAALRCDDDESVREAVEEILLRSRGRPAGAPETAPRRPLVAMLRDDVPWGLAPGDALDTNEPSAAPLAPDWIARRVDFYRRQHRTVLALQGHIPQPTYEPPNYPWLGSLAGRSRYRNLISIRCSLATTARELPLVGRLTELRRLGLPSGTIADDDLRPLANLVHLRDLDLSLRAMRGRGLVHVAGVPSLDTLTLGQVASTEEALAVVARMKGLRSLGLREGLTDAGMAHLGGLAGLEQLRVGRGSITDAGMAHLAPLTNLVLLRIAEADITDAGLAHLAGMKRLEELMLGARDLTDAGMAHLATLPRLKTLSLSRVRLGDEGLVHLGRLGNLELLRLGRGTFTDVGLGHLAGLTKLQTLRVLSDQVTDSGLVHFQRLPELRSLAFWFPQVSDAGLPHLYPLTNLEFLTLERTQATPAGVEKLQAVLPDTQIRTR